MKNEKREYYQIRNLNPEHVEIVDIEDRRVRCLACGHIWWIHPGSHKVTWQCKECKK